MRAQTDFPPAAAQALDQNRGPIPATVRPAGPNWCRTGTRFQQGKAFHLAAATAGCMMEGAADLPANRNACIPTPGTPIKTVRLKFNVFRNDDGSNPAATQAGVDAEVTQLNSDYAPARIQFVYQTAFINSTRFRSFADAEEAEMKNTFADQPQQQHNVYVVNIEGDYVGVSVLPWDPQAVDKQGGTIVDDGHFGAGKKTLSHEIGHALGLYHTFAGVNETDACSACYERADGQDGDITGDFCSDTPPTPTNYDCGPPGGVDPCSNTSWGPTQPNNYMSYAPDSCYTLFTPQQMGRMHCWTQDRLTGLLVAGANLSTVSIIASDAVASEAGIDTGLFTIRRTGSTTAPLTVHYTLGGTAGNGSDFNAVGPSLLIPAGSASATLLVRPINDTELEPSETVIVILAPDPAYLIAAPGRATVTLADDDSQFVFSESFDQVTPPGLPAGWSASLNGLGPAWRGAQGSDLSAPNAVFAPDPDGVSDTSLTSPSIPIASTSAQLTFQHRYSLEAGFDGGVLEISINGGAFADILAAGGTFASNGYNGPLSKVDGSPIAGRAAWTGVSAGNLFTRVRLPAGAAGKSIRLRWRCASDSGTSDSGWTVDTITVVQPIPTTPTSIFANPSSVMIVDVSPASPYPSVINVSGLTGTVTKVSVTLKNLSHPFPDDLDALLVGPGGQTVLLMSDAGGNQALTEVTLTFDNGAANSLGDQSQIVSGTFKPTNYDATDSFPAPAPTGPYGSSLSVFVGTDPNGIWRLFLVDDLKMNAGQLAGGWGLAITHDVTARAPHFSMPQFVVNQGFTAALSGVVGKAYRVEASSNLVSWTELFTRTNVTGTLPISDPSARSLNRRFYRAAQSP